MDILHLKYRPNTPFMKINNLYIAVIFLLIGCQKNLTEKQADVSEGNFKPAYVQQWFNNNFKHTAEYAAYDSLQKGRKELNWKKGFYQKSGKVEVISFPLIKQKHSISSAFDKTITDEQFQKMLSASFTRVLFSKNIKNEISVRELDYVPEYKYLESKNFSRAQVEVDVTSNSNRFCGSITAKKWGGQALSVVKVKDGRVVRAPYTSHN